MRHHALPDTLTGAVRSRIGNVTHEMLRAVADADLVDMDRTRTGNDDASRIRGCVKKVTYGRRAAHRAARIVRASDGGDARAYPCEHCARWHVGHGTDIPVRLRGTEAPDLPQPKGPPSPPVIDTVPAKVHCHEIVTAVPVS